jgi:small multidrug resistance pump
MNFYSVAGIVLYGLSFMLYVYLISKNDLGYIIPLAAAFVYIVIFIASAVVFKEVFTATKIIGIAMIVVGLIFLNLKK